MHGFLRCALLLATVSLTPGLALAAVETVDGITVDVHAEDGMAARDKGFAEARLKAVEQVLARQGKTNTSVSAEKAERATTFIDVLKEKSSSGRYIATLRVGVDTDLLAGNSKNSSHPAAESSKAAGWVLIIPVHRSPKGAFVWDKQNPWVASWSIPVRRSGTDFVATGGDAEDKTLMSTSAAATADEAALQRLANKYGASAIALITLDTVFSEDPENKGVVEVALWAPSRGVSITRHAVEGAPLELSARDTVLDGLDTLAKSLTPPAPQVAQQPAPTMPQPAYATPMIEVPINIALSSPGRWLTIRQQLESIPGLEIKPLLVSPAQVDLIVRYPGTRDALVEQLRMRGLLR